MTTREMIKETMPWMLLVLLFAGIVRLSGIAPAGQPQGGATSEQIVSLQAAPGATVTGVAIFSYDSAKEHTTIALTLMHLPAGSVVHAELRDGTCADLGTVVQAFPGVRATGQGAARLVAYRDGTFASRRWAITIQGDPSTSRVQRGRVLACGALSS